MNPIDEAAAFLTLAKLQEQRATEARIEAERALVALLPTKDEGSVTHAGESYKVAVTYGVNRTIDAAALSAIKDQVPPALFEQAITYKPALQLPGLRYLQSNEPEAYALLAQAITAKPAKPSVKLEPIAQMQQAA
jgi:hypothetical protein